MNVEERKTLRKKLLKELYDFYFPIIVSIPWAFVKKQGVKNQEFIDKFRWFT